MSGNTAYSAGATAMRSKNFSCSFGVGGQRFAIVDCGRDGNGHRIEAAVCAAFRKARWTVTDLFRPGYGGENHADVYIGEETGPGFTGSPFYTTLSGATLGPS